MVRIGVDTGGTFRDRVLLDASGVAVLVRRKLAAFCVKNRAHSLEVGRKRGVMDRLRIESSGGGFGAIETAAL